MDLGDVKPPRIRVPGGKGYASTNSAGRRFRRRPRASQRARHHRRRTRDPQRAHRKCAGRLGRTARRRADDEGPVVPGDHRVCVRNEVPGSQITQAIAEGAHDIAEIGRLTLAGTGCGTCRGQRPDRQMSHLPPAAGVTPFTPPSTLNGNTPAQSGKTEVRGESVDERLRQRYVKAEGLSTLSTALLRLKKEQQGKRRRVIAAQISTPDLRAFRPPSTPGYRNTLERKSRYEFLVCVTRRSHNSLSTSCGRGNHETTP